MKQWFPVIIFIAGISISLMLASSILLSQPDSLAAFPPRFWLLNGLLLIIPLICLGSWIIKPRTPQAAALLLAGFGYYLFMLALSLNGVQKLSAGGWAGSLSLAHELAAFLLVGGLWALTLVYPLKLLCNRKLLLVLLVYALWVFIVSWLDYPRNERFELRYLPPLAAAVIIGYIQFGRTKTQPLEKTVAKVMQPGLWLLLASFSLLSMGISQATSPGVRQLYAVILAIAGFLFLAVSITRYRLSDLDYGWLQLWLWLLSGVMIIVVSQALLWLSDVPDIYALGLALLFGGFLYFPLKNWLFSKLEHQTLDEFLPHLQKLLTSAATPREFDNSLQETLMLRFSPKTLQKHQGMLEGPEISQEGLSLSVPSLQKHSHYRLVGKHHSSRLFSRMDLHAVEAILAITRMAYEASENRQQAVLAEREQLLEDIHETVGKHLKTASQQFPDKHRATAAEILATLDETVRLATPGASLRLDAHLSQWKNETQQRIDITDIELEWQADQQLAKQEFPLRRTLELAQFLREAVSNAIKHANPERLLVCFQLHKDLMLVRIENDGDRIVPVESWKTGTGLKSMEERIRALNGQWSNLYLEEAGLIQVQAWIPLTIPE